MTLKPTYWELNEEHNALDYLEASIRSLVQVERNPWAWKWVCIAIHGALYGFAVCAVKGTNSARVTYKDKSGKDRLKSFDHIIQMCQQDEWMKQFNQSKTLVLGKDQKSAIDFLKNELRNKVEHYIPGASIFEIHGLPAMMAQYYDIIHFLALESGNVLLESDEIGRVKALCNSGKNLALSTKIHWEISEFPE